MGGRELHAELGRLVSKVLDLLLAVSSFIVFRTFVDLLLTVLQHAIDQSGQPMGHGGDRLSGVDRGLSRDLHAGCKSSPSSPRQAPGKRELQKCGAYLKCKRDSQDVLTYCS